MPATTQLALRAKPKTTRGAFGKHAKTVAAKQAFIASSQRQALEISGHKRLRRAYADFYATKEGKEFLKKGKQLGYGKSYDDSGGFQSRAGNADPEFHDPSELPQARVYDNPIDNMEPEDTAPALKDLPRENIDLICDTFKHVFRWVLDGAQGKNGDSPLVCVGKRCNVAISLMRPDLGHGLKVEKALSFRFRAVFKIEALEQTGAWFGRVLEWLRRGEPLSARGERVYLLAYQLWPSDINAATLASLGGMNNKTRQAKDKQSNCLRDTMSGLKAITQRADITRDRCRASQLAIS